jgi:CheY-like chemotaxis protein
VIPAIDSVCKLVFKVVDTGCGLGKLDPIRLFYPQHGGLSANPTPPPSVTVKPDSTLRPGHRSSKSGTILTQFMSSMLSRERSKSKSPPSTPDGRSAGFRVNISRKVTPSDTSPLKSAEGDHVVPIRPAVSMSRYRSPQRAVLSSVQETPMDHDGDGELGGIGIGLPMAKQIVDMMHGTISLARVEGSSTVLSFAIPSTCVASSVPPTSRRYRVDRDGSVTSDGSSIHGGPVSSSVFDGLRATASTSSPRFQRCNQEIMSAPTLGETCDPKSSPPAAQRRSATLSAGDVVVPVESANGLGSRELGLSPVRSKATSGCRDTTVERVCNPVSISEEPEVVSAHVDHTVRTMILAVHSVEDTSGTTSPGPSVTVPSGFSSIGVDTAPISRESPEPSVASGNVASVGASNKFAVTSKLQPLLLPLSTASQLPSKELAGMRVLVVDDERAIRRLCQRMLERLGCTCVLLEDGDQVLNALLSSGYVPKDSPYSTTQTPANITFQPFHAVLMDIMMVRSNGVDVVIDMRNSYDNTPVPTPSPSRTRAGSADGFSLAPLSPYRLPPFIAMTANTSLADITNYKRAGFVNVLGKPFDLSALRSKLLVYKPTL